MNLAFLCLVKWAQLLIWKEISFELYFSLQWCVPGKSASARVWSRSTCMGNCSSGLFVSRQRVEFLHALLL